MSALLSSESYRLVIDKFLAQLQNGTLKAGDKIYSEHQLALSLGIPRAQVREVYAALSVLGILYGQQGRGTFLGTGDLRQNTEILYLMTLPAGGNFQHVLEVRRTLETGAVQLAVHNRTEEDLGELRRHVETMEASRDPRTLTDADTAFHAQLAHAAGNGLLHSLFLIVMGYMARISLQHWTDVIRQDRRDRMADYAGQHRALYEAVLARDGARAEELVELHFTTLKRNYGLPEEAE